MIIGRSVRNLVLSGKYELVWSYILDVENYYNPYEQRRNTIKDWRSIAKIDIAETPDILFLAEQIKDKGVKTKDALHIACAIQAKCDYFITTDKKLLNKSIDGILIVDPIEFIKEREDDNNDDRYGFKK